MCGRVGADYVEDTLKCVKITGERLLDSCKAIISKEVFH